MKTDDGRIGDADRALVNQAQGPGPPGFDPLRMKLTGLCIERRAVYERLRRCDDLFGKMLMIGKLHAIDRQIKALSDSDTHPTGGDAQQGSAGG